MMMKLSGDSESWVAVAGVPVENTYDAKIRRLELERLSKGPGDGTNVGD